MRDKGIAQQPTYTMDTCRICHASTKKFLDLGATHPPEEFRTKEQLSNKISEYPLGLSYCPKCGQVQLSSKIPPDVMYRQNYFYDYSVTSTGFSHWKELTKLIIKKYKIGKKDLVVDIGSNTGTLLLIFKSLGVRILGIDPATKLVRIARKRGIPTIGSYFSAKVAKRAVKKHGRAKVITCNSVFDHVDDLYEYMEGIPVLLDPKGIFIVEVPYFGSMVKTLDHVVYHQQIDYLLVKPFAQLFDKFNMEIVDCEQFKLHGGSIRLYIGFKGVHKVSKNVADTIKEEEKIFKNKEKVLSDFAKGILNQRDEMVSLLKKLKKQGKSIAAVGASAKGNILLYYSNIGPETIDFLTEKSPLKIGRYTPSGIPVVDDKELLKRQPDYALLLAWNFEKEILKNLKEYTDKGGKFVVPIPKLKVLNDSSQ